MNLWKKKSPPRAIDRLKNIEASFFAIEREYRTLLREHPIAEPFLGEFDFSMLKSGVDEAHWALRRIFTTLNGAARKSDYLKAKVTSSEETQREFEVSTWIPQMHDIEVYQTLHPEPEPRNGVTIFLDKIRSMLQRRETGAKI